MTDWSGFLETSHCRYIRKYAHFGPNSLQIQYVFRYTFRHFVSASQNVLKYDLKRSHICHIWGQSGPFWPKSGIPVILVCSSDPTGLSCMNSPAVSDLGTKMSKVASKKLYEKQRKFPSLDNKVYLKLAEYEKCLVQFTSLSQMPGKLISKYFMCSNFCQFGSFSAQIRQHC